MKVLKEILFILKLVASIAAPTLFIANSFTCVHLYPDFKKSWDIFIPMDLLCHNFWALVLLCYGIASTIKTKYIVGDLFLYFGMFLCAFDCGDRFYWGIYTFTIIDYWCTIPVSALLASLIFIYVHKSRTFKS